MLKWGRDGARPPSEVPVLDTAFLDRLGRHVGHEALTELLADGLIEIVDRLDALARAVEAGARADALALGHDLAGLAGHLGLTRLSHAAVAMNRAGRDTPDIALAAIAEPVLAAGLSAGAALRTAIDGR